METCSLGKNIFFFLSEIFFCLFLFEVSCGFIVWGWRRRWGYSMFNQSSKHRSYLLGTGHVLPSTIFVVGGICTRFFPPRSRFQLSAWPLPCLIMPHIRRLQPHIKKNTTPHTSTKQTVHITWRWRYFVNVQLQRHNDMYVTSSCRRNSSNLPVFSFWFFAFSCFRLNFGLAMDVCVTVHRLRRRSLPLLLWFLFFGRQNTLGHPPPSLPRTLFW